MKNIIMLILCLLSFTSFSQQNLQVDFKPLKSVGILPHIFTKPVNERISAEIHELNQTQDSINKIKSDLLTGTNYAINWAIKSGNTLINEEITAYLNDIADVILKDQPELRKKIKIYTSKSPVVNAASFYDGTVFINLGFLASARNEAQVAAVMSHEITHYTEQHLVNDWIHTEKLESTTEGKSSEDVFKEKCQYSRDQEIEADSGGFVLIRNTNYDITQTMEVFDILQYSHLPFELLEFDMSYFETENFKIPGKYILKEVAPVKDLSDEDDLERTHPNPAKRKEIIRKMIDPDSKGAKYIVGEERFIYTRDLARFEICRLLLRYRDYNAALYAAYMLSKKYPDNLFLIQTISKCLYAISLNHTGYLRYNKDSYLDGPIHYLQVEGHQQQLYYLINKMTDSEWNVMALNYVFRKHKKFPADKILSALSDSLIKTMQYVNANFETSGEVKCYTNVNPNPDTTSWFSHVFADLFSTDKEFTEKFPKTIGHDFVMPYTPKSYHTNRFDKNMRTVDNIGIVMCLSPTYRIYDDDELQANYREADFEQKKLVTTINNCASAKNFQLVVLDPGLIDSTEVSKINDYSIITDWLNECSDAGENEKQKVPIFNTDELPEVVNRYGTSHVLRTGFVILKGKIKKYVFFAVIYDLKENRQVYIKQESIKGKPSGNDMEEKICSLFKELKYGKP